MKKFIFASMVALAFTTNALAQSEPAKSTSAIKTPHTVNDGGAEAGRNSFTRNQAKEHIANAGFTDVSALAKGDDGIWRGTANKDGHPVNVALDFKGNVTTSPR